MPVPLALAAPAAIAGLAYLNAKTAFSYDASLISSVAIGTFKVHRRASKNRLNMFYILEEHAQDKKLANTEFLIFGDRRWTYKQTYETVLKYASWLKTVHGVKPKEIIAMDFGNSDVFIFIWLALWSLGATPAFINYNLTGKALAHCVQVAKTRLMLIDADYAKNITEEVIQNLPTVQIETFSPHCEAAALTSEPFRAPDADRSGILPSDIALLIYTSGTTGLPKGAIVPWIKMHVPSSLISNWAGFKRGDIFYTCMPLYHSSAAVLGVSCTLGLGATICIGKKFSARTFWPDVRASKATIIQYVGETCRYLLSAPVQYGPDGENLDKKNNVRVAFGNGLRPDVWDRFKERFDIEGIAEFYSATEGHGSLWNFSRNSFSKGAIGRNGTLGYLLNRKATAIVEVDHDTGAPLRDAKTGFCKKVPWGEPGEALWKLNDDIASQFQGYYGNSAATDSKIMRDVLVKGDVYYRSGDMIRWDKERTYFSDRIGDTFRWKSENVSTNQVSESLGNHPAVEEANVYGVELPHHDGRAGCVQAILAEEPNAALMSSLAAHVHKDLPKFAVPLFIRVTKNMGTTGTNKQQKHVVRQQGVDPTKMGDDVMFWLRGGTYTEFGQKEWRELHSGSVKL